MITRLRNPRCRRGFSMLEAVISLTLLSIVMVSVGSAMIFAAQATPDDDSAVMAVLNDHEVLSRITDDLSQAIYITEQTATAVTAVVPDRTGDGVPDRLRYAWGGAGDDPLTYAINGSAPGEVAGDVAGFKLTYTTKPSETRFSAPLEAQAEQIVGTRSIALSADDFSVTDTDWIGQRVTPDILGNPESYRVTSVRLMAKYQGNTQGVMAVEIREADASGIPTDIVLASAELLEASLPASFDWVEIEFDSCPVLTEGDVICVVVRWESNQPVGQFQFDTGVLIPNSTFCLLTSTNGGQSWSADSSYSMLIEVNAEPVVFADDIVLTRSRVTSVGIEMSSSASALASSTREVRLQQAPEVLDAFWRADFSADPTLEDLHGDGVSDWDYPSGSFPSGGQAAGVWNIQAQLAAAPVGVMDGVVTLDTRLRTTTTAGFTIVGPMTEASNGELLPIITKLCTAPDGTQTMLFYNSTLTTTATAQIAGIPPGWVDLSLVMLPDEEMLAIKVNGNWIGSIALARATDDTEPRTVTIKPAGTAGEIDFIRIHVGGSVATGTGATTTNNGDLTLE